MAERRVKLSRTQLAGLADAAEGVLRRNRHGWSNRGWRGHAPGTIEALERRGLVKIDRYAGCAGEARITAAGRKALAKETGNV